MYYLVGKHHVPRRLNARSFFWYELFSSTQAALSNVLTESMALFARIAKCEVRIHSSPSRSVCWLSFRTLLKNLSRYSCRLHLNVLVQKIWPSSGYPTNCESFVSAKINYLHCFCGSYQLRWFYCSARVNINNYFCIRDDEYLTSTSNKLIWIMKKL